MKRDTIHELAARASRWIAVEALLFETLGGWARQVPEPAVKRVLATWCHRHAWHADLWRGRLPDTPAREHVSLPDDVSAWLEPLQRVLSNPDTAMTTDDKVGILLDPVLTAVRQALDEHRGAIDPRLDGPTARILDLVAADLDAEIDALGGARRALAASG